MDKSLLKYIGGKALSNIPIYVFCLLILFVTIAISKISLHLKLNSTDINFFTDMNLLCVAGAIVVLLLFNSELMVVFVSNGRSRKLALKFMTIFSIMVFGIYFIIGEIFRMVFFHLAKIHQVIDLNQGIYLIESYIYFIILSIFVSIQFLKARLNTSFLILYIKSCIGMMILLASVFLKLKYKTVFSWIYISTSSNFTDYIVQRLCIRGLICSLAIIITIKAYKKIDLSQSIFLQRK